MCAVLYLIRESNRRGYRIDFLSTLESDSLRSWGRLRRQLLDLAHSLEREFGRLEEAEEQRFILSVSDMVTANAHLGHLKRRWNPKTRQYLLPETVDGRHIVNIPKALPMYQKAYEEISSCVSRGGQVLFVNTKKSSSEIVADLARRVGEPYSVSRWVPGTLTNFATISRQIAKMEKLSRDELEPQQAARLTKKERLIEARSLGRLERDYGGVKKMRGVPSILFVVDPTKDHLAVSEAHRVGSRVVGIVDSNCDPDPVDLPLPGNDDGPASVELFSRLVTHAIAEGKRLQKDVASSP